jgi:hypothetical protein
MVKAATTNVAQSIATSIVAQVGTVAHITVTACAFVVAHLRGLHDSLVIRLGSAGPVTHALAAGGVYKLDIQAQAQEPASYRGAKVNLAGLPAPVQIEVVVEGSGLDVSNEGKCTLEVKPWAVTSRTVEVRPTVVGKSSLRVDFYNGNAWMQRLDLALEVKAAPEMELLRGRLAEAPAGADAIAEAVDSSITLPTLTPDSEPRHLQLTLNFEPGQGRTYHGRANDGRAARVWRELDMPLREADLKEHNDGLREALEDVRRYFGDQLQPPDDAPEYLEMLDRLARRGNDAFNRVFPNAEDREYLIGALGRVGNANLEISSNGFFLPWELIYEPYDGSGVKLENFWGFRYNIGRVLTDARQRESPLLTISGLPRIAVFANPELPFVAEQEVPFFQTLERDRRISLYDWLNTAHPERDASPRATFFEYCRSHENDVAHFACHAVVEKNSRDSYIALSSRLRVRLQDMTVEKYQLMGSPFVVVNACGTSIRDPSKTSDFVREFMLSGGRGVVATECDVPDLFASVFIQHFYARLLEGEPFVRALLEARHYFLKTHNNPLGLLYSAYLPFEARLVTNT